MSGSPGSSAPYDAAALREAAGLALRPGGLALTDRAMAVCPLPPEARLLDVGCGAGATVEHLQGRGFRITGLDPSPALLEAARQRNAGLSLREGRAEHLPMADRSLDGVLCECVLSLLDAPRRALAEFRRVLHPGGWLILSDLYERTGDASAGPQALAGLLADWDFRLVLWEDHTRLLQELAARLLLAGCSLDRLCRQAMPRPGYYLAVARLAPPCQPGDCHAG
jgi:SAM-dependent methyltransferase